MHRSRFIHTLFLVCALGGGLAASVAIGSAATGATTTATTTTTVAPPSNKSLPSISGNTKDGHVLSTTNGGWSGSPTAYAYAWERCDSAGGGCAALAGANSNRYTAVTADVGRRLRVVVTASNAGGSGMATSGPTGVVSSAGDTPTNTKAPFLTGASQYAATLRVDKGSWSGTGPISYDYTWQRCDASGVNNCITFIAHQPGATAYQLGSADLGHTVRVEVQATNSQGSNYAFTAASAVIAGAPTTIAVGNVALPDQLVLDKVAFSPSPVTSRSAIQARFHVSDAHGLAVQGALVYALGLPYGWTYSAGEVATDSTGWATLTIRPTPSMPLRPGALVLFVRARKPGDNLLAGVSARRLVQVGIR
jgi:hypothetical protein